MSRSNFFFFSFPSVGLVYKGSLGVLQYARNHFLTPFVTIWTHSDSLIQSTSLVCFNGKVVHCADTEERYTGQG